MSSRAKMVSSVDEQIKTAAGSIISDIQKLSNRRGSVLGSFRKTAEDLGVINSLLEERIKSLDYLSEVLKDQKATAEKMTLDNEAVKKRILDIIGE